MLSPSQLGAGKKLKEKGAQDILELAAPITKYVPTTRTEVLYQSGAPRHDSLSPTASAADSGDYNRSQRSNDSGKSSGYASGYMTDDSMTAEGQLLRRATQTNPASVIMTIVKDYKACCGEEMTVKKGQRVKVMYRQGDWAYAMSKHGGKGFIPYSFVRASRKYPGSGYTSEPDGPSRRHLSGYETDPGITTRTRQRLNSASTITSMQCRSMSRKDIRYTSPIARNYIREETPSGYMSECVFSSSGHAQRQSRSTRPPPTTYFRRNFIEKLVVLHDFTATDEDEVVVTKGEEVRVLNADDASWLWVQTMHGREGYVPRNCLPFGTHPGESWLHAPLHLLLQLCWAPGDNHIHDPHLGTLLHTLPGVVAGILCEMPVQI